MKVFLSRLMLILCLVIFQRSFLDIVWPGQETPTLLLSMAIAFSFLFGFERGMLWTLGAVFLASLIGSIGPFPLFCVGVVYVTSYVSRRLRLEQRMQSLLMLMAFASLAALGYPIFSALWYEVGVPWRSLWGNVLEMICVFPLVFGLLRFYEEWVRESHRLEFRNVRV